MRCRRIASAFHLSCLLTLASLFPAIVVGQSIEVGLAKPQIEPFETGGPEVMGYELSFDFRLSNPSDEPVSIPDLRTAKGGPTWVSLAGVQTQEQDGTWRTLFNGDLMVFPGNTQYPACGSLAPHSTVEGWHYTGRFAFLRDKTAGLGPHSTIRLALTFFCRQSDGEVITRSLLTDAIVVSMRVP